VTIRLRGQGRRTTGANTTAMPFSPHDPHLAQPRGVPRNDGPADQSSEDGPADGPVGGPVGGLVDGPVDGLVDGPVEAAPPRFRLSPVPLIAIALGVALTAGSAVAMVRAGGDVGPEAPPAKVFASYVEDPAPVTPTTLAADPAPAPNTAPKPPPPNGPRSPWSR
jgi:hypothetical protein